ncbi:MAG: DUF3332 domain-containing protein [Phocaeicola sp.]
MKKGKMMAACLCLSGSLLFSSCIGSFALWNNLKDWNNTIGNKFVNELVFIAFNIVPVYPIAAIADMLVINSIEFWSGSNPMASIGETKEVQGENGNYLVTTNENGYTIAKEGESSVDLTYNTANKTWSASSEGESCDLVTLNENGSATLYMGDGTSMTVMPDAQGVANARMMAGGSLFMAAR